MALSRNRLRGYVDANVILSGVATDNPHSASRVVLVASELTLLDLVANERAIEECNRNLEQFVEEEAKLRELEELLQEVVSRSIEVVETPAKGERQPVPGADPKDLVHLLSAAEHGCDYLITANTKDFPESYEGTTVLEPGTLVKRIREQIKGLS
jgi:predicted nucleic acid-binding protein